MNIIATKVGIDVSKDVLDVFIDRDSGQKAFRFRNDKKGICALIRALEGMNCLIALEATGR